MDRTDLHSSHGEVITGEYSQDGGAWQTLSEDTDLSAYDGDLVLRVKVVPELMEGAQIKFYLNHIGMKISVNGKAFLNQVMKSFRICAGMHG